MTDPIKRFTVQRRRWTNAMGMVAIGYGFTDRQARRFAPVADTPVYVLEAQAVLLNWDHLRARDYHWFPLVPTQHRRKK